MQAKLVVTVDGSEMEVTGGHVDLFARKLFSFRPAGSVSAGAATATLVPVHQKRQYVRRLPRLGTHHKWTAEQDSILLSFEKPAWGQLAKLARKWHVRPTAIHSRKWALKHPTIKG